MNIRMRILMEFFLPYNYIRKRQKWQSKFDEFYNNIYEFDEF